MALNLPYNITDFVIARDEEKEDSKVESPKKKQRTEQGNVICHKVKFVSYSQFHADSAVPASDKLSVNKYYAFKLTPKAQEIIGSKNNFWIGQVKSLPTPEKPVVIPMKVIIECIAYLLIIG